MSRRVWAALGAVSLLSACATPAAPPPASAPRAQTPPARGAPGTIEFRTSDFGWSTAAGKGQIDGQLTYKVGNVAYSCAQAGVLLTPETPWVRRRMEILYTSAHSATLPAGEVRARTPPERSQDYSAFVKRTTCDAAGRFSFSNLPDGAWYVITVARPASGAGQEMAIMKRVETRGRAQKVTL